MLAQTSQYTYLLNAVLVTLLQRQDLIRSLLCVVNLLPGLLLFLLKKGDTICEQLGISLNTKRRRQIMMSTRIKDPSLLTPSCDA